MAMSFQPVIRIPRSSRRLRVGMRSNNFLVLALKPAQVAYTRIA
jgi:hypothetical protein